MGDELNCFAKTLEMDQCGMDRTEIEHRDGEEGYRHEEVRNQRINCGHWLRDADEFQEKLAEFPEWQSASGTADIRTLAAQACAIGGEQNAVELWFRRSLHQSDMIQSNEEDAPRFTGQPRCVHSIWIESYAAERPTETPRERR